MTNIQWTDETWNPTTGCNKVSQGCKNCYAEKMHRRLMHIAPHKYTTPFLSGVQAHDDELLKPLGWKKPRRVFVNSMSDLFHDDVDFTFIIKVFVIMAACPQHTFQILTKRPENLVKYMIHRGEFFEQLPNVWFGVSVEDQATANERIPLLLQVPAAIHFLSCEPLLGSIDVFKYTNFNRNTEHFTKIDWVIAGGESGHDARPMHPDWVRSIRDQCKSSNVPFFFKQWGTWCPEDISHEIFLLESNRHIFYHDRVKACEVNGTTMCNRGKSKSGNMLDGVQHMEFPK